MSPAPSVSFIGGLTWQLTDGRTPVKVGVFYLMHELLEHGLKRGGACLKAVVKVYSDLFSNCLKLGSDKSLLSCANSDATTVSVLFVAVYRKYISELPMSVPFAELAEGLTDKLDEIKLCSLSLMTDLLVATKGTKPNSKKDIGKMVVDAILSMLEPKSKTLRAVRVSANLKKEIVTILLALKDVDIKNFKALQAKVGKMQDGPSLWTDFVSKAPELRA